MAKQICHPGELRKALEATRLMQHIFDIQGEDQKQQDGTWLPICEIILKQDVPDVALDAIEQIYLKQCARDWKSWVPAQEKLIQLEQKSGYTRANREFILKAFTPLDYSYKAAKMIEDQIIPLRAIMAGA